MNSCPKIGTRVKYRGSNNVGACVGIVTGAYPTYYWPIEAHREGNLLPEREWHVSMKPDVLPEPWCYVGQTKFSPCVKDLSVARASR